jgi:NAD(P)-dependent dehydrogenase (short-subunit alcohol dehydrogenase family)
MISSPSRSAHNFQVVDVASDEEVKEWARQVIKSHGAPQLVLNNAAVMFGLGTVDGCGGCCVLREQLSVRGIVAGAGAGVAGRHGNGGVESGDHQYGDVAELFCGVSGRLY